ncbi:MAG TPA: hypothetical protein VFW03_02445 [Gemmatimonadaceae bacterium]|nr:hypothetical protein [Gemmatimonadaceae bacterium]
MMIVGLLFSVLTIYLLLGWLFIGALDRHIADRRDGIRLWIGVLFWPITVLLDLFTRRGSPRG